jgi:dipeptidyl aminopeptidase/acylaminoacyl peptidase
MAGRKPCSAWTSALSSKTLPANGYVVIFVNPRNSTGYGTAFGNAILKHYPHAAVHDELVSALQRHTGVAGASLGAQRQITRRCYALQ